MIWPIGMKMLLGDPRENELLQEIAAKTPRAKQNVRITDIEPNPPAELPDSLLSRLTQDDVPQGFKDGVAAQEVPGHPYDGYGTRRDDGDGYALGRYQMRRPALLDVGMIRRDGSWTGKYGVNSAEDFLNSPRAQDAALKDLTEIIETRYIKNYGSRIGKTIKGLEGDIVVSKGNLVGAVHKQGIGSVGKYFDWLEQNAWDSRANKQSMSDSAKAVETRLRLLEGVPYR